MKISYTEYNKSFKELAAEVKRIDESGSIRVFEDFDRSEETVKLTMNFSGKSYVSAEEAITYAGKILAVAGLVRNFRYNGYEIV